MNEFIKEIIKIKITELIESIQSNIPDLMTKEDIEQEIKYIIKCINYTKKTVNANAKNTVNANAKNTVNAKTKKTVNANAIKTLKSNKKVKINKNIKIISDSDRCNGRIWGIVRKVDGKDVYGSRCKNKSLINSKYCFIHNKKLTHGDFLEEPDKFIKEHFINERPKKEK
jgi:hypothetical protein